MCIIYYVLKTKYIYKNDDSGNETGFEDIKMKKAKYAEEIVVVTIACGPKVRDAMNMIKSILIYNVDKSALKFIVFTKTENVLAVESRLYYFQFAVQFQMRFELRTVTTQKIDNPKWLKILKRCAIQKIFFAVSAVLSSVVLSYQIFNFRID